MKNTADSADSVVLEKKKAKKNSNRYSSSLLDSTSSTSPAQSFRVSLFVMAMLVVGLALAAVLVRISHRTAPARHDSSVMLDPNIDRDHGTHGQLSVSLWSLHCTRIQQSLMVLSDLSKSISHVMTRFVCNSK